MLDWKQGQKIIERKKLNLSGKKTILIVDDEKSNLNQLEVMLSDDYNVITADNGENALELAGRPGIVAIVSDQRMPGMSGTELFEELEKKHHPAPRIILTGYAEINSVISAINSGRVFRYLTKPVRDDELSLSLRQGIEYFEIQQVNLRLLDMLKDMLEDNAQMAKQLNRPPYAMKESLESLSGSKKINLAILITDIRGFSAISSSLDATRVMALLQAVHVHIHNVVRKHDGKIDKHMGDGLMAFFGLGGEDNLKKAAAAVKTIAETFAEVSEKINKEFGFPVKMGVGLSGGMVTMGMLGSENRSELTIVGRTVSLAHRLQDLSKNIVKSDLFNIKFGQARSIVGLSLPDFTVGTVGFQSFELPADMEIKSFPEIRTVSVITG